MTARPLVERDPPAKMKGSRGPAAYSRAYASGTTILKSVKNTWQRWQGGF
jgi:hypothetical protein